jgi:stage III sporulation protein AD
MDFAKVCLLVLFLVVGITYFKQENQNSAFVLKLAGAVFLGLLVVDKLLELYDEYFDFFQTFDTYKVYIRIFLKALGICYICEFVSNMAKEEGLINLSAQVELIGKLSVFSLGIPILVTIFNYLEEFIK